MDLIDRLRRQQAGSELRIDDGDVGVCPNCIGDVALARFVARAAHIAGCAFCGEPGPGMRLAALFSYMDACLGSEWDDPAREGWPHEWDGVVVVSTSDLLLGDLQEPLAHPRLRQAFVEAFPHEWCRRSPHRLAHHDILAYSWEEFARYVREDARYLFLRSGRSSNPGSELIEPAQFLEELQTAIANSGLVRRLRAGTRLVRARQHLPEKVPATPADLGSPPPRQAPANRMSPPGIPMFYAAQDLETALAELRPEAPDRMATVSEWTSAREIAYLDLVDVEVPSIFDMTARHMRTWLRFLARFAAEVSQPVAADDAGIDYVPTQIVTEYVRHAVLASDGEPVRGIRYRSAVRPSGVSWVLFVDAGGCAELQPGWEADEGLWLAVDKASIRRFRLGWQPTP